MRTPNSRKRAKGQGMVDYLFGNAWIILAGIVAFLVLWQLGVFTPPAPRRGDIGFSQLEVLDYMVSTSDVAYIRVINNAGAKVKILPGAMNLLVYQVACNTTPTPSSEILLNPGQSKMFVFYCQGPWTPKISDVFKVGYYYEGDLTMEYVNVDSGNEHTSVGKFFGPIEGGMPIGPPEPLPPGPHDHACCDQCTAGGTLDPACVLECPYCYDYLLFCVKRGDCGAFCTDNSDCSDTCCYCENNECKQGDCGAPCISAIDDCKRGCTQCVQGRCASDTCTLQPECTSSSTTTTSSTSSTTSTTTPGFIITGQVYPENGSEG